MFRLFGLFTLFIVCASAMSFAADEKPYSPTTFYIGNQQCQISLPEGWEQVHFGPFNESDTTKRKMLFGRTDSMDVLPSIELSFFKDEGLNVLPQSRGEAWAKHISDSLRGGHGDSTFFEESYDEAKGCVYLSFVEADEGLGDIRCQLRIYLTKGGMCRLEAISQYDDKHGFQEMRQIINSFQFRR